MNPFSYIERFFNIRTLERELSIAKDQVSSLGAENEQLRQKVQELEEIHDNPLKFDVPTGTWVNESSGLRYCAKCKSQNISSPLRNGKYDWSCPVCNGKFPDPSRAKPMPHIPEGNPYA